MVVSRGSQRLRGRCGVVHRSGGGLAGEPVGRHGGKGEPKTRFPVQHRIHNDPGLPIHSKGTPTRQSPCVKVLATSGRRKSSTPTVQTPAPAPARSSPARWGLPPPVFRSPSVHPSPDHPPAPEHLLLPPVTNARSPAFRHIFVTMRRSGARGLFGGAPRSRVDIHRTPVTPRPGCAGTSLTRQTPSAQNRWSLPSVQSPTAFGHGRSPAGGHSQHGPRGRGPGATVRHARKRHRRTQRRVRRLRP